ncbi:MAG: hypothetical protein V3T82_07965 [Nitrospinaceae bacterium]
MSIEKKIHWSPPGPVSAAFMASKADVQLINGPIGSGKTSTVLIKGLNLAGMQRPSILDGIRKFKLCVVRDTYRQLWKTTIPSWWEWVPKAKGQWSGAKDGPATHKLLIPQPDGTLLEFQIDFVAIGENSAESVMRGYQPTAFYLNELDMLSQDAFTYAAGRAGRFPPRREGGCTWYGILGDFNAPELDTWLHEMVLDTPEGIEIFRQPGGREIDAENLQNLEPDYYERQIRINRKDPQYIKRMVDNEAGYNRDGKPVYPNFSDNTHVSKRPLEYLPGLRLEVGLDAALHPAAVFLQIPPNGQKRIIGELVPGRMGPTNFSRKLVDHIKLEYPQADWEEGIRGYCDPSAVDGGEGEDVCWLDKVREKTGLRIQPAFSNALSARLDPVSESLLRLIDGVEPEFLLSPTCKSLRKGFNGGYRYAKIAGSNARFSDMPEKNEHSHPQDGLQYVVMSVKGSTSVATYINKRRQGATSQRTAILSGDGSDMRNTNHHNFNHPKKASM